MYYSYVRFNQTVVKLRRVAPALTLGVMMLYCAYMQVWGWRCIRGLWLSLSLSRHVSIVQFEQTQETRGVSLKVRASDDVARESTNPASPYIACGQRGAPAR